MENSKYRNYLVKGNKLTKPLPPIGQNNGDDNIQHYFHQILRGCININEISDPQPKEIRIFLSSTFTDFKVERNLFIKKIIPGLQSTCNTFGLNLQFCDMRWGVTDSAVNEHLVEKLCLKEIEICRKTSIGPFYILLIGNRYGYQPVPSEIPSLEFEQLFKIILETFPKEADLFSKWFKKDENAQPHVYHLLPIRTHIPKYADYENEIQRREAGHEWWKIEETIRRCLKKTCEIACNQGILTNDRKYQLTRSVTENEFWSAIMTENLCVDKRETARCLVYERQLTGLMNDLQSDSAIKYIDYVTRDNEVFCDSSAQISLSEFKRSINKIGLRCFRKSNVPWVSTGITEELMSHKTYLDDLTKTIINDIKTIIFEKISILQKYSSRFNILKNHLQSEIIHHWMFCSQQTVVFCGRAIQLEAVFKLIYSAYNIPIIIHGKSGCGKTALLSKIGTLLQEELFNENGEVKSDTNSIYGSFELNQSPIIILRFIGTSPYSSTLQQLLFSLCLQIQIVYNLRVKFRKMTSLSGLKWLFNNLLQIISRKFSQKNPLIIILDSIDNLFISSTIPGNNSKHISCEWIPVRLPPGIHIIISLVTELPSFQMFKRKLCDFKPHFIEIDSFDIKEIVSVFQSFLEFHKRTLNEYQMNLVISKLIKNPQALFVKVSLELILTWQSYLLQEECIIGDTVESAINFKFSFLEKQYGSLLISYALGYLTLGYNGLSELEIEDLLSLQDDVLNEVYQYHDPPIPGVIRLPSLLWARIHSDLSGYLVKKQIDGKITLSWYHNLIHQCALERYTKNSEIFKARHNEIANYYTICGNLKKTCILKNHKRILKIKNADRLINNPPVSDKEFRKLHGLAHHLMESGQDDELSKLCITNLKFLLSYAKSFGIQEFILWIKLCDKFFPNNKLIHILKSCVIYTESLLEKNVDNLPIQLLGQLNHLDKVLFLDKNKSDVISNEAVYLLQSLSIECREIFANSISLIPSIACFPSCFGSIKLYKEKIDQIVQLPGNSFYIILIGHQGDQWNVRLFQPRNRVTVCSIALKNKPISVTIPNLNLNYIYIQDYNSLCVYDTDTSQLEGKIDLFINKLLLNECMAVDNNGKWIAVAAQNRIAILENKLLTLDKNQLFCKLVLVAREVDKTLSMCFIQSVKHALLITAHTYNSKSNRTFLLKIWQFEQSQELWSMDLQTLPNSYGEYLYIWPFSFQDKLSHFTEVSDNKSIDSVLIVLPNGICFFINNVLDRKSFRLLTNSVATKSNREKLRSIYSDGEIVTVVRSVGNDVLIEKIDRSGNLVDFDIPSQISSEKISFSAVHSSSNSTIIGLKSGIIYCICNNNNNDIVTWAAHRSPIDYAAFYQPFESDIENIPTKKFITYSHKEKVVKCWNRNFKNPILNEKLSETIFEKMNSFAFSDFGNLYAILDETRSEIYTGTIDNIENEIKTVKIDSEENDIFEKELESILILEIEIVFQNQALLIFFFNKIKLYNLNNGKLWSSIDVDLKPSDRNNEINNKIYWYCLRNQNELLFLTFKRSIGYFNLDCFALPSLTNIRWSKRFLPPINFTNPSNHLEKIVSFFNGKQNFLILLWKNSNILSNIVGKERIQEKRSFQFMSLHLQDPTSTLCLIPCFNQEEAKKVSAKNIITRTTNQSAFTYAIPDYIPNNYSNDIFMSSNILIGGYGEILIWDMESGSCRLPKIPNFQTWFKHSAVTKSCYDIENEFSKLPSNEQKTTKARLTNNVTSRKFKNYPVTAILITQGCSIVISGCSAGFIVIWKWADTVALNGSDPDPISKYRFVLSVRHCNKITCLATCVDDKILFSGSADLDIFMSNIISNQCLQKISIHCCPISLKIVRQNDCDNEIVSSPKLYLICKAIYIGQSRMLLFDILQSKFLLDNI